MAQSKHFYLTTTLPYVNAEPHVGFAMEIIRADSIARYHEACGEKVFFNTGTDEHGQKIYQNAGAAGKDTQAYVDIFAERFRGLQPLLGLKSDLNFIRTTDAHHVAAAQEFWKKCEASGDIYKKNYSIKYCVGCELEKTDSELVDGKCPIHPSLTIESINEENYFFRFSKYQSALLELYNNNPTFVVPEWRLTEVKKFVAAGLEDFSISRLKTKMPWGVPVPGDDTHVMYVWFDALVNYISAIGWPIDMQQFESWWPVVQVAGKDNLRQQSAMWQAMLMSVGIAPSKQIVIGGFITGAGGMKMSKSLGNVINPYDIVKDYGTDALRYFVLREIQPFEDSPFTVDLFKAAYNANLANGIGNLLSRVMKLVETHVTEKIVFPEYEHPKEYVDAFAAFELHKAMNLVWKSIGECDQTMQTTRPFELVKTDKAAAQKVLTELVVKLGEIAFLLRPFLPDTAHKIEESIEGQQMPKGPLFLRKE